MKKKSLLLYLGFVCVLIVAAIYFWMNSAEPSNTDPNQAVKPVQSRTFLSTDFLTNRFEYGDEAKVLKALHLCDSTVIESKNLNRPSCTPNFFRLLPLKKELPLSEGCMVLLKAGVNGFPVRRLVIYEREGAQLIQANGFIGYPIELRPTATSYDDIVIRFFERYEGAPYFYNCLFTWKNRRYQFVRCEEVTVYNDNGIARMAKVKPEKIESFSKQVFQILREKQLVF
jgi:hypothetical protein